MKQNKLNYHLRKILFAFIVGTILLFLESCSWSNTHEQKDIKDGVYPGTVKVGHLVALDMAPLFVAKEAGFFEEEGINLETIFFANPGDNNTALAGGSIQFSINPFTLPYFGANSGIPMRIVSSAGGLGVIQVVIQGNYNINDIEELIIWVNNNPGVKLKIGVLKGDTLEMIVYKLLQDNGLTYDDFDMIWFNDLLAMVQAFQTNQIDILSHIQPYTTDLQVNYGAKLLTDNNVIWGAGTPNCTIAVLEDFSNMYPETVQSYLRATQKAFDLIVNDPNKAIEYLKGGNYYKVSDEVLLSAFKTQTTPELKPNVDGIMIAITDMVKEGYIKEPKTNIVDPSFLNAIEKQ